MNKIEVYHAGTERVEHPLCKAGRANVDFGPGFYITDIYSQAQIWAMSQARRRKSQPVINIYLLDSESILKEARVKIFDKYDEEWLDFIVACRAGEPRWKDFDYIEGGIADDRVIDTVNMYIQGFLPKSETIRRLQYLNPNNQICINDQSLIDKYLTFTDSIILPDYELL